MPVLNTADTLYLGATAVDAVYAGSTKVWPPSGRLDGGTITVVGGYRIHTFTASGTLTHTGRPVHVDVLVVAGGGAGGRSGATSTSSGGGGAGAVLTGSYAVSASQTVTVGAGGTAPAGANSNGLNGADSSFGAFLTALGGGGGGGNPTTPGGGSGGGAENNPSGQATAPAGLGTPPGGHDGGLGNDGTAPVANRRGGGGGGAGAPGTIGRGGVAPNGGAGISVDYSGTPTFYGGGGGGGASQAPLGAGGVGGGGPGGAGDTPSRRSLTSAAVGAASTERRRYPGAARVQGIVIVRYRLTRRPTLGRMPRRGSPYGPAHERRRRLLIRPGARCHQCGAPASEVDHVPPLALHHHVEGSGCCRSLPACGPCQRAQAAELGWNRHGAPAPVARPAVVEPLDSPGPDAVVWCVPWLDELRQVPADGSWPRYMTVPHPAAVGSYGAQAIEWLGRVAGIELRWFQQLTLVRQLEHDADGVLVWLEALETTARQVGKSTLLRAAATWRLHQAELFGEEQTLLHTGKDLPVCKEVQRLARAWGKARGYPVREQNGNEQITDPISGSRWIVRGKGSVYGYPGSYVLVDEAWGVAVEVVEDGLEPTMAERKSPQMVLASTAHSRATGLFPAHRTAALAQLAEPESTLLLEWSAHRDTDIADRAAWRKASPHWSDGRERLLGKRLTQVQAGESLDPDEADPVESFRSQFLNVWPLRTTADPGSVLVDPDVWAGCAGLLDTRDARIFVAVEDHYGRGAAVAAAARAADGRYEVDGWLVDSWEQAFADVDLLFGARSRVQLVVGATLELEVPPRFRAATATGADTRAGLALIRQFAGNGRVVHDVAPDLDQLTTVKVREMPTGLTIVAGARADLVRATAWALHAAHARPAEPSIA